MIVIIMTYLRADVFFVYNSAHQLETVIPQKNQKNIVLH